MNSENVIKNLEDFLNSEEGRKVLEDVDKEMQRDADRRNRYVERIASMSKDDRIAFIHKVIHKYESNEYVKREYSAGYEPRTPLYWLLYDYCQNHAKQLVSFSAFESQRFLIDDTFILRRLDGQGSIIQMWARRDADDTIKFKNGLPDECDEDLRNVSDDMITAAHNYSQDVYGEVDGSNFQDFIEGATWMSNHIIGSLQSFIDAVYDERAILGHDGTVAKELEWVISSLNTIVKHYKITPKDLEDAYN